MMNRLLCLLGIHTWRRISKINAIGEYTVECHFCAEVKRKLS